MKHVNEILDGKKLDEFISESDKDKILELRASASIAFGAEKRIRDSGGNTERRRKYIGFLSAIIQECDKHLALAKKRHKRTSEECKALEDDYKQFERLTREIAGEAAYQKIIEAMRF